VGETKNEKYEQVIKTLTESYVIYKDDNISLSQYSIKLRSTVIYATADEADAYVFYICFFLFFFVRHKNTRQPFSGTTERIFMKR